MGDKAIRVEALSKRYRIGGRPPAYRTIREAVVEAVGSRLRRRNENDPSQTLWALQGVSFDVESGEALAVIGPNGAGKSTLLKILSRITRPTEGRVEIRGRVASLIEIGTGFHAELTGRENVFLNGAILGMRRSEMTAKFDEIVAFAEVERFIDTPVKHYSSGMYLRLAFAVAAHLDPDVLLVDEVLAVGDAAFQRKCLGRMEGVAAQGRTVLFVSHSMAAVQRLCRSGVVLAGGRLAFHGPVDEAIRHYFEGAGLRGQDVDLEATRGEPGRGVRMTRFWLEDAAGVRGASVRTGEGCSFAVEYTSDDGAGMRGLFVSLTISTSLGTPLVVVNTNLLGQDFAEAPPGGVVRFRVPRLPLTAGRYLVDLGLGVRGGLTLMDSLVGAATFDVEEGDFYGTGRPGSTKAPCLLEGTWSLGERG